MLALLKESQHDYCDLLGKSSKQKTVFWILVQVEEAYIHCSKNIPLFNKNDDPEQLKKGRPIDYFELADS